MDIYSAKRPLQLQNNNQAREALNEASDDKWKRMLKILKKTLTSLKEHLQGVFQMMDKNGKTSLIKGLSYASSAAASSLVAKHFGKATTLKATFGTIVLCP